MLGTAMALTCYLSFVMILLSTNIGLALDFEEWSENRYLICGEDFNSTAVNCYTLEKICTDPLLQLSNTWFELSEGKHNLNSSCVLISLSNITFTGSNSTVSCGLSVGLTFIDVANVSFYDLSFVNCGTKHVSTSPRSDTSFEKFLVALYFESCEDVSMEFVNVTASQNATGIVMYDTIGYNTFQFCNISDNRIADKDQLMNEDEEIGGGGGGVYIEFTYCKVNTTCNDSNTPAINEAVFYFHLCIF